jgi:Zn-dependent peptidase ImmA (M78 family)
MVGAFRSQNKYLGVYGGNTILVYNWGIEAAVQTWNQNNPNQQISLANDLNTIKRQIALHELGHVFLGNYHTSSGLMRPSHNAWERLQQVNQEFLISELQVIQSQPKPL